MATLLLYERRQTRSDPVPQLAFPFEPSYPYPRRAIVATKASPKLGSLSSFWYPQRRSPEIFSPTYGTCLPIPEPYNRQDLATGNNRWCDIVLSCSPILPRDGYGTCLAMFRCTIPWHGLGGKERQTSIRRFVMFRDRLGCFVEIRCTVA